MKQNLFNITYRFLMRFFLLLPASVFFLNGWGQTSQKSKEQQNVPVRNYRVLEEHKDRDDNVVRTVEYYKGNSRITESYVIRSSLHKPIDPDTLNKDSVLVIVNKSRYVVEVYYRNKMIRSYKAVFGPRPLENKKMEGDRCTPEGWFTIQNKNPRSKYNKFMLLNYPNDSCTACFNRLKENGALPKAARIGGDIGIHGIWQGGDDMIDKKVCWTDGCIAIKNKDADELYTFVGIGTRVFIKK